MTGRDLLPARWLVASRGMISFYCRQQKETIHEKIICINRRYNGPPGGLLGSYRGQTQGRSGGRRGDPGGGHREGRGCEEQGAAALVFELNAQNTKVGFLGTKVVGSHEGVFEDVSGELTIVEGDLSRTKLLVKVKTASVKTDSSKLDEHLRSGDFFKADEHPEATFELLEAKAGGGEDKYQLKGNLTIRGASRRSRSPLR